eukprot:4469144-Pyramimonas_sp.AAC.1
MRTVRRRPSQQSQQSRIGSSWSFLRAATPCERCASFAHCPHRLMHHVPTTQPFKMNTSTKGTPPLVIDRLSHDSLRTLSADINEQLDMITRSFHRIDIRRGWQSLQRHESDFTASGCVVRISLRPPTISSAKCSSCSHCRWSALRGTCRWRMLSTERTPPPPANATKDSRYGVNPTPWEQHRPGSEVERSKARTNAKRFRCEQMHVAAEATCVCYIP